VLIRGATIRRDAFHICQAELTLEINFLTPRLNLRGDGHLRLHPADGLIGLMSDQYSDLPQKGRGALN
jgi:hypothetical protein